MKMEILVEVYECFDEVFEDNFDEKYVVLWKFEIWECEYIDVLRRLN